MSSDSRSIGLQVLEIPRRSPQIVARPSLLADPPADREAVSMTLAYATALADARACLAALAGAASDFDESVHFEHLLLDLDALHPEVPGLSPISAGKVELLAQLEAAVDQMIGLGGDGLSLELLLAGALVGDFL